MHNHIKIVNDLAKRVKEEIQSLVGMNADLKWEKAKAEVTSVYAQLVTDATLHQHADIHSKAKHVVVIVYVMQVTAKAYCTELLTTKKNNATKKMRAQLCRLYCSHYDTPLCLHKTSWHESLCAMKMHRALLNTRDDCAVQCLTPYTYNEGGAICALRKASRHGYIGTLSWQRRW